MALTSPDCLEAVKISTQTTAASFKPTHIKTINKTVAQARTFFKLGLSFPSEHFSTLHSVAYSDASFATNEDPSSQLGFMILPVDGAGKECILNFANPKSKRLVRYIIGTQIFSFADALDEVLMLCPDLRTLFRCSLPLPALTDRLSFLSILIRSNTTTEQQLLIYLQAARETCDNKEIGEIRWIPRTKRVANALTK